MVRAVFDTNVLVSSLIKRGKPRLLWREVVRGKVTLVSSPRILKEFDEVMAHPKLKKYVTVPKLRRFKRLLLAHAILVKPITRIPQITSNPEDNIFLETAYDGKARYIVSGDKHLLKLKMFRGIKIVAVDSMLRILKSRD